MFEIQQKNSTEKLYLKNLPTLRQAFVAASFLVLGGLALAFFVHPYFLALPALVGFGLLFAGTVGICPMVTILEAMPWNRRG